MQPIRNNQLDGHLQVLRQIFKRQVEAPRHEVFTFERTKLRHGIIEIRLQANSSTEDAIDDFDREAICAVLASLGTKKILCSYGESWNIAARDRLQFRQAALIFFLTYGQGGTHNARQIFRLEWENWQLHDKPTKAAYPHWQFDRWLTGSDAQALADLKASLAERPVERIFEVASPRPALERADRPERPDLGWFTKVHFPLSAMWAAEKIKDLDALEQPHRSLPSGLDQLENWIESALWYVSNELKTYAIHA